MKALFFTLLFLSFATVVFATTAKKELQLLIHAQNGSTDRTTIYFDFGISTVFILPEDGPKVMNSIPGVPNLFSLSSDNVKCAINGFSPLTESAVIGIGVQLDSTAFYTFTLTQFRNFDPTTLIIFEDRQLHIFKEMQVDFYTVQLSSDDTTGRFFLHVTKPVQFSTITAGCDNDNGAISINADSNIIWNAVSLSDTNYGPITSYINANGQFAFNNLPEGIYHVALNYDNYAAFKTIKVNGTYIVVNITASSQNVVTGEPVNFHSTATNASGYVWDFGDGTVITGVANPTDIYYWPGVDTVSLLCTNSAGCSAVVQIIITVTGSTGFSNPVAKGISIINRGAKIIGIMMNDITINNAELQVYNLLGQAVYSGPVTANQMQVSLFNQTAGIYLVSIKNGGKITTAKVYLNN